DRNVTGVQTCALPICRPEEAGTGDALAGRSAAAEHGPAQTPEGDAATASSADDVLEEDLIDERAALRARDEDLFVEDAFAEEPFAGDPFTDETEEERR